MMFDGKITCNLCWEPLNFSPMSDSELEKEMKEQKWIEMPFHTRTAHICPRCFEKSNKEVQS